MGELTAPFVLVGGPEGLREIMRWEAFYLAMIAVATWLFTFLQKKSFSLLGENVTYKIRVLLYDKILQKNIGWYDLKENGTGNLTSTMAQDTSTINLAAGEAVAPILEGVFALGTGVFIACFYCWQVALICLGLIPIIVVSSSLQRIVTRKQMEEASDSNKEAQVLCGDAISNYKTVQSFGYEHLLVDLYKGFL